MNLSKQRSFCEYEAPTSIKVLLVLCHLRKSWMKVRVADVNLEVNFLVYVVLLLDGRKAQAHTVYFILLIKNLLLILVPDRWEVRQD